MARNIPLIVLVMAALLLPAPGFAKDPLVLKSITVSLPESGRTFPEGPGSHAINDNCLVCHSADMVLNQPAMSKTAWQAEVDKMRNVYKAPVEPGSVAAIVDYLARTKGPQ
jgi:hypothetical protein